jgi:pimeloyl-ACP methyl ester carboxylesterase
MSAASFQTTRSAGVTLLAKGDAAAARTIVFLHGIGGRADGFRALMSAWPDADRLIAWDAPGYGESDPLTEAAPSPADYAAALLRALDGAGADRIHLVGQSLGALFAASFAARHPGRIVSLTLMAPAPGYGTHSGALTEALARRIADFDAEGSPAFAAARAGRLVNDPDRKPEVVAAVRAAMSSLSKDGHTKAVHALAQGNLAADCAGLRCPVLLITGAEDAITPLAGTTRLFDALRARPRGGDIREQMTIIGDAGHALFLEHPAATAAAIHAFIGSAP